MVVDEDHKREIMWEEAQEQKEEAMRQWIDDNRSMLITEFIEYSPDEFEAFCRDIYFKTDDN